MQEAELHDGLKYLRLLLTFCRMSAVIVYPCIDGNKHVSSVQRKIHGHAGWIAVYSSNMELLQ
jgi:hypothetical protein